MNRLGVLGLRLRYRLRGVRYGHTALTDPTNVQVTIVCRHCGADQQRPLPTSCPACGGVLRAEQ